ncbi:MAG: phosphotyrosine protein phosphatase [Alteromonadaceae bacterium]|uniref:low molecular weight protein-tyrosine-phosphatase n=1 Tax=Marinobacter sp. V034 TaxID=3459610 RepID=UPI000C4E38F8|nr:phosphotyrosine protein phosphatase [Alteromonadaceae bacterium]MBH85626.1 phosphotyrosine protein phosphatase [Alteromonadaceae bacterium]|tara:strand:- start:9983 stop:10465 length:483 start_codon:yes stop_codon:yes gene_type:complete
MPQPIRVLFVCLGNICRSPTAQGVLEGRLKAAGLADSVSVDSCGTGNWHVGEPADARASAAAKARGYDLSALRARQFVPEDLDEFDYVLTMDRQNQRDIAAFASVHSRTQPRLFLEFAGDAAEQEVPDPYYGGQDGFAHVLDLVEAASDGLIEVIKERLK